MLGGYTSRSFCGFVGWLVVLQSTWWNPLAPQVPVPDQPCLISQKEPEEIRHAVQADDGRVYDAVALRTWLQRCRDTRVPMCVIPTQPIGIVKPVRLHRPLPPPPTKTTVRSVGTQTPPLPMVKATARRATYRPPTIPSRISAFRSVHPRARVGHADHV